MTPARAARDHRRSSSWFGALALVALLAAGTAAEARAAKRKAPPRVRDPWLLFPVDLRAFERVSSQFGMRKLHARSAHHGGVDLKAPSGSWVVAAREGRVTSVGRDRMCGWFVRLEHENGWRTVYCHLRKDPRSIGLHEGAQLPALTILGEVGSTGHSTGPHLHFTLVDPAGRKQDPLASLYTPAETYELLRRGAGR
jgi:murein DD-endopeptidase MepM/ murein hydrolase activator NlpD